MLTSFQLRASRSVLGLGVREVGDAIDVSRTTISVWERQTALQRITSKKKDTTPLELFFKKYDIIFPDEFTISLVTDLPKNLNHLTRFQLRAARSTLGLTLKELSSLTNIPMQIIAYLESKTNYTYINSTPKEFDESFLRNFFEQQYIRFLDDFTISLIRNPNNQNNLDILRQVRLY